MNIIDAVVLSLILFSSFRGGSRGLWLTLARLFGVLAAAAFSWYMHPAFKAWLRDEPGLVTGLQKTLLGPFLETVSPDGAQDALTKLVDVLNSSELPRFIKNMLLTSETSPGVMVTLNETTLSLLSFIALLLVTYLVIQVAALILDRFFKLPGLSLLNRAAGVALGAAEGVFLVWIALSVMTPWIAFRPDAYLAGAVRSNGLTGWLYEHNFLLSLVDFTLK